MIWTKNILSFIKDIIKMEDIETTNPMSTVYKEINYFRIHKISIFIIINQIYHFRNILRISAEF